MMNDIKKLIVTIFLLNMAQSMAKMAWVDLNHEQQKILLPFQSSWNSLDDAAKQKLMLNTNKWLDMSPQQRIQSRKKLNRYKNLSQQEREKFQKRFKQLKNLTPLERKQLEQARKRFQHLDPKEKARLRKKYQQLPPEKRKRAIQRLNRKQNQKEFINKFDIEKRKPIAEMFKALDRNDRIKFRQRMKDLSQKERHKQVLDLLRIQANKRAAYIQGL